MNFATQLSLQSVSFGQVNYALLREFKNQGYDPDILPIGQVDVSAQDTSDKEFFEWLKTRIGGFQDSHNRNNPALKLWHLNGSLESVSKEQTLFTFHETNSCTQSEINAINNQKATLVSSKETKEVFETFGAERVVYCPLGFDKANFYRIDKQFYPDTVTTFGLTGKLESRKNTVKTLKLWVKLFGNNRKYQLKCLITNPFIPVDQQEAYLSQELDKHYWNVQFYPRLQTNAEVNQLLNQVDVNLDGLSSFEGFNLPLFHSLCLGKNAVVLNAHVHKDFCNSENSILVEPCGFRPAVDNIFFRNGEPFNQGFWYDWNDDDVAAALEESVKTSKNRNTQGEKLKDEFSYEETVKIITHTLKS